MFLLCESVMSGKGQVEFNDGSNTHAGSAPRKGVMDFGDDESPERRTSNDNCGRGGGISISEGETRLLYQNR